MSDMAILRQRPACGTLLHRTSGMIETISFRLASTTTVAILAMMMAAVWIISPLQAQISASEVEAVEGPWECRTPGGVAGIFVTAVTLRTSQSISIRVYQRQAGQEHSGYFSPTGDSDGSTDWAGKHLVIHFEDKAELPQFDLDIKFDPVTLRWAGLASLCEVSQVAVLDRPRPRDGVQSSLFVGDWDGYQDPTAKFHGASGSLHIRQSYDGELTAWLDRRLTEFDQRNGELLIPMSATGSAIVLRFASGNPGPQYRYEGMLSADNKNISGEWLGGFGGTLNAPTHYRLVSPSKGVH